MNCYYTALLTLGKLYYIILYKQLKQLFINMHNLCIRKTCIYKSVQIVSSIVCSTVLNTKHTDVSKSNIKIHLCTSYHHSSIILLLELSERLWLSLCLCAQKGVSPEGQRGSHGDSSTSAMATKVKGKRGAAGGWAPPRTATCGGES